MSRLSRAGKRTVPIASVLREHVIAHRLRSGRVHGLVFGREATRPFNPTTLYGRAATAWKRMNVQRAERNENPIAPIGLHEARHTFASVMIAAGALLPVEYAVELEHQHRRLKDSRPPVLQGCWFVSFLVSVLEALVNSVDRVEIDHKSIEEGAAALSQL
jgi:hypothetical protein